MPARTRRAEAGRAPLSELCGAPCAEHSSLTVCRAAPPAAATRGREAGRAGTDEECVTAQRQRAGGLNAASLTLRRAAASRPAQHLSNQSRNLARSVERTSPVGRH